jgi:hypothetical protein
VIAEESEWLSSLKYVEERSVMRAKTVGILKGVTMRDVKRGATHAILNNEVQLRDGWVEILSYAVVLEEGSEN